MSLSTQQFTSTGVEDHIILAFPYIQQDDVHLYYDSVEVPYTWASSTRIDFAPAPAGAEVLVRRITDKAHLVYLLEEGVPFTRNILDQIHTQLLYLEQEGFEGSIGSIFGDVDLHGFKIRNAGAPELPGDYTTRVWVEGAIQEINADYGLREDLAEVGGSTLISFQQAGVGATPRTSQSKMRESNTFGDFGAKGDASTDDSIAVQKALSTGRPVKAVAAAGYKITAPLLSTGDAAIVGEGLLSAMYVSGLSPSTDALVISPPADGNAREYAGLSGVYVLQSSGGRHAVNVDVNTTGKVVSRFVCEQSYLRANGLGHYAFNIDNPTNAADRFFLAYFENSVFDGGALLNGAGDSLNITGNTFTGVNEALALTQTTSVSPGAFGPSSMLVFERNNSTANKGVYIIEAQSPKIKHNNLECGAGPGAGVEQALVNLKGQTRRILGAEVCSNLLAHAPNCTTGVFVGNTNGALIENNIFGLAASGYGIVVSADAKNTRIGYNTFEPSGTGREVHDLGVGTKGVLKTPTLLNGWTNYGSGYEVASFIKTLDGFVRIYGAIGNGAIVGGTPLFVLPGGFRPAGRCFFSSYGLTSGGVYATTVLRVDTDGTVRFVSASTGASPLIELGLSCISFLAPDVV